MLLSLLQALGFVALVYGIHAAAEDDFDKWSVEPKAKEIIPDSYWGKESVPFNKILSIWW